MDDCARVVHGRGMCQLHYNQLRRRNKGIGPRTTMTKEARECIGCGRTIQPRRGKIADYPNTVTYGSAMRCTTCYKTARKEGVESPGQRVEALRLENTKQGLAAFIARRNARLDAMERTYRLAA